MKYKSWFYYLLFVGAALTIFFLGTGSRPLWSSDEGRYAEIAREMWETKNFVIPQFHYIDWLEKPVLAFALTALSYGIFGVNEFAVRFIPALSGVLGILITFLFTRRLFDRRTAELSALMLMTTAGYVLVARFAVIDMLMTLWISCALFCFMTGYFEKKRNLYLAAYVFMGLAFLTKGLIGMLLPGLVMGIFLLIKRDFKEILKLHILPGILILAVVILPWWLQATAQKPDFFRVFILEHHFSRFATKSFGRVRPFWFYLPIFPAACFPWIFYFPGAVRNIFKAENPHRDKLIFLLIWATVILVFFSIPRSKLPYYILPLAMPVVVICAAYIPNCKERFRKFVMPVVVTTSFLLMVTAGVMYYISPSQSVSREAEMILKEMKPGAKVAIYSSPDSYSDLAFYLKRKLIVLGSDRGTLAPESRKKKEYAEQFMELGDFTKSFNAREQIYFCLMHQKRFEDIKRDGLAGYRILSQANKKILITNS